jgi:alpha-tubulin suppressor-like RCC1 family protein
MLGQGTNPVTSAVINMEEAPTQIGVDSDWQSVAVGDDHVCGLKNGGELWCWGGNGYGQLGDSTNNPQNVPEHIQSGTSYSSVFAFGLSSCGINQSDSNLYCWGYNGSYNLGLGNQTSPATPTFVSAVNGYGIVYMTGTTQQTIMINNWNPPYSLCVGYDSAGQCGLGSAAATPYYRTNVSGMWGSWKQAAIGNSQGCGFDTSGALYCWGAAPYTVTPTITGSAGAFSAISSDASYFCGIAGGAPFCWGYDYNGVLGNGVKYDNSQYYPQPAASITTRTDWTKITTSYSHVCGLAGSKLYCWGQDDGGQQGDSLTWTSTPIASPIP